MTMVRNGSVSSYAAVAVAAALISAAGTWGTTQFVATSGAQPVAGGSGQLLTQPLADLPGLVVPSSSPHGSFIVPTALLARADGDD